MRNNDIDNLPPDQCGCGCTSVQDKAAVGILKPIHKYDPLSGDNAQGPAGAKGGLAALDNIGCDCGSAACSTPAAYAPGFDGAGQTRVGKYIGYGKENWELLLSFLVFFYGLFSGLENMSRFFVFAFAYILIARDVFADAVQGLFKGRMLDENFLMGIASLVAFAIGEYAEAVAVMLFFQVGQMAEHYALSRSKKSISALLDIKSEFANIKTPFGVKKVNPDDVSINDIIVVKAGEKIPLDGTVIAGNTNLDTSAITGESLPAAVQKDSVVYSGSINLSAVIEIRVEKDYASSTVSKILELVEKTNQNKAKTEKFISRFAKVYTPTVVATAVLIAVFPTLLLAEPFAKWIYRAAIFLVVSCPCALVISVPLGYFGGIGGAAKAGILIKGGNYLEVLKNVGAVVFDKTGTLTKGNFKIDRIDTMNSYTKEEILCISAHLEGFSNHPIAKAISDKYSAVINEDDVKEIKELPGKGVKGLFQGSHAIIGNQAMMDEFGVKVPLRNDQGTILFLAVDKVLSGILSITDEIKQGSAKGIAELKEAGIEQVVMLTGDRDNIAQSIAEKLGITRVYSQLLPHEKVEKLEEVMENVGKKQVVFVGDGINDAPVLSRADAGIAMGALGSDVAIEAADVVLMTDEITKVAEIIRISKFTSQIIWQNIVLALGVKAVIMVLGTVGIANMWMAVFGDVGVAIIAIINSGRAIYFSKSTG
ncbi:MAG: cadmium-translocating P-type ATPase [Desulfobacteraceae bacterium]|nr:cadmium-translocating P-type ATPase [Desulfobacteraceae bacterium]